MQEYKPKAKMAIPAWSIEGSRYPKRTNDGGQMLGGRTAQRDDRKTTGLASSFWPIIGRAGTAAVSNINGRVQM
jgi:hypothetical protein